MRRFLREAASVPAEPNPRCPGIRGCSTRALENSSCGSRQIVEFEKGNLPAFVSSIFQERPVRDSVITAVYRGQGRVRVRVRV